MTSSFEKFKNKANKIHNNKYDYSKFVYISSKKVQSIIICPEHGEFLQTADIHTRKEAIGCPACVSIRRASNGKRLASLGILKNTSGIPEEEYLNRLLNKYNNKYTFEVLKYSGVSNGVIKLICMEHGEELHSPQSLLISTFGCTKCANKNRSNTRITPYREVERRVHIAYYGKYVLTKTSEQLYVDGQSTIEILCPTHGIFHKKVCKLLSGQGCFKCKLEILIQQGKLPGGYCEKLFIENPTLAESKATLYYLRINSKFYKIGITIHPIERRIQGLKCKAKGYIKEIYIIQSIETTLKEAFEIEQEILRKYSESRTIRRWSSELFKHDVLKEVELSYFLK